MSGRKNWFLTREQQDRVERVVYQLFRDSLRAGRNLEPRCPDYAQAFGILQGLFMLDLLDVTEREEVKTRLQKKARQDHLKEMEKT